MNFAKMTATVDRLAVAVVYTAFVIAMPVAAWALVAQPL